MTLRVFETILDWIHWRAIQELGLRLLELHLTFTRLESLSFFGRQVSDLNRISLLAYVVLQDSNASAR